jgi:ethanolamine utilization protein EutN
MNLSRVTGKVVSTRKDPELEGCRLLVVQQLDLETMEPTTAHLVAVDNVGANEGDTVLIVTGSSARMAEGLKDKPVDTTIIAIVDAVHIEGRERISKQESAARR